MRWPLPSHVLAAVLPVAALAFLFVGFERRIGEHDDSYTIFVKQAPTLQTVYLNPADCGMCEIPRFEDFSEERLRSFAEYCRVRFGIDAINVCHAIFREKQKIVDEQAGPTSLE